MTESVDDLRYDWPVDVLHYESRMFLGLSMQEGVGVAAVAGLILMQTSSLPLGLGAAVIGYLLVKRFEGLGDRNLPAYLVDRLTYAARSHEVTLPVILPGGGQESVVITDLDGGLIAEVGGLE